MRFSSGMVLALAAGLALSGCASAGAGAGAASTSPTGKSYPPGTEPTESDFTTPAKLALAQQQYQTALTAAQQGIEADSTNPQHFFLAGEAYAGLENYAAADSMFRIAERIYPAYELQIEPERESAWATAFNEGVNAYNAGNTDDAVEDWENANLIYQGRPEAFQNLAAIYTQQGDYDKAIAAYRAGLASVETEPASRVLTEEEVADRADSKASMIENLAELLNATEQYAEAEKLFRQQLATDSTNVSLQSKLAVAIGMQPGREAEAEAIYTRLLSQPDLGADDMMNIGVALFNSENYERAAEAFKRLTTLRPNSRDAWYNYASSLYAADSYPELVPVAEKLVQVDPLSEDAALYLARAYKETAQNDKALAALQTNDALPVKVKNLQMHPSQGQTSVTGTVVGNKAAAGTPITLRFTFYNDSGELGMQTVNVTAPAADATGQFEVSFVTPATATGPATGYTYEMVS